MNEGQVQDALLSPAFRRLQERLNQLKAEQARLMPPPGFLRLDGHTAQQALDEDQVQELRRLEISIDKVTMALNDYCRRQGQPDWY